MKNQGIDIRSMGEAKLAAIGEGT
ncbi:hypothetical protein EVA_08495, partial [gut metagenome]